MISGKELLHSMLQDYKPRPVRDVIRQLLVSLGILLAAIVVGVIFCIAAYTLTLVVTPSYFGLCIGLLTAWFALFLMVRYL